MRLDIGYFSLFRKVSISAHCSVSVYSVVEPVTNEKRLLPLWDVMSLV